MNNKLIPILVVVVIVILALAYLAPGIPTEFPVQHNDPNYTFSHRMLGTITFADGTTKQLTESAFPLALTHSGNEITAFTWILEAKAATPAGSEPYDVAEVYYAYGPAGEDNFYLSWAILQVLPDGFVGPPWSPGHGDWYPTDVGPVNKVDVPIDSSDWTEICTYTIPLTQYFTQDVPDNEYKIRITPKGWSTFAGRTGTTVGETQSANMSLLPIMEVIIDWAGYQVTVNWNTRYEFTYA